MSRPGFTTLQVSDETRRLLRELQNHRRRSWARREPWSADAIIRALVRVELNAIAPLSRKAIATADVEAIATDSQPASAGRSE